MISKASTEYIRLFVLDNGRMYLRLDALNAFANVKDALQPNIEIPIYTVLIDHPDGRVLFDAACHPNAMGPAGRWHPSVQAAFPYQATKCEGLLNRLAQLDLEPTDIDHIVCSHLHCDHAGHLEFFPNANIWVHENELNAAFSEHAQGIDDGEFVYEDIDHWKEADLKFHVVDESTPSVELLSGLRIHNLGRGHSYGMLGLEVQLVQHGTVLLASDAAFSAEFFDPAGIAPALTLDKVAYLKSVSQIRQLAERLHAEVWYGHDMQQFGTLKKSPLMYV